MALEPRLQQELVRLLGVVDEAGTAGPRLMDDYRRLWGRVQRLISMSLVAPEVDADALELACFALQLPHRQNHALPVGRLGQVNLRDRAEQSAELLIGALSEHADEALLDRAGRLLAELPQRAPMLDEARLLADAVNLDDFGLTGLLLQAVELARQGSGLAQVAEGCEKRQQYGYWEARLKDGFHFEPVRQIARRRWEHATRAAQMLLAELKEDHAP